MAIHRWQGPEQRICSLFRLRTGSMGQAIKWTISFGEQATQKQRLEYRKQTHQSHIFPVTKTFLKFISPVPFCQRSRQNVTKEWIGLWFQKTRLSKQGIWTAQLIIRIVKRGCSSMGRCSKMSTECALY